MKTNQKAAGRSLGLTAVLLIAVTALLAVLFAAAVYAEPDKAEESPSAVISSPSANILSAKADFILDDFESRSAAWQTDTGTAPEYVSLLDGYPYTAYEGDSCVKLTPEVSGEWKYISYDFADGIDLSAYSGLSFVIYCRKTASDAAYETQIELTSGEKSYKAAVEVPAGTYYAAVFDVSGFDGTENVDSLTVSVRCTADDISNAECQLDFISFSSSDLTKCLRYLSDDFYLYGGSIAEQDDCLKLSVNATVPFFELYSIDRAEFGDANGITLKLINRTASDEITMSYTTLGDVAFIEERSHTEPLKAGEDVQYITFPIDPAGIEQIRFSFSGRISGELEIISILPAYTYSGTGESGLGEITGCTVSDDLSTLTVTGVLSEYVNSLAASYKLQLYAVPYTTDVSEIAAGTLVSVAQTQIGSEFSFSIPLESDTDPVEWLYKKFAVGISSNNRVLVIDSDNFITNPEVFGTARSPETSSLSSSSDRFLRGAVSPESGLSDISAAAEEIKLEQLFAAPDSTSVFQRSIVLPSGETLKISFSEDYVSLLDALMQNYADEKVEVTLALTLRKSGNTALDRILIHPEALQYNADGLYAFNTESDAGLAYLRAAGEFLAGRYGIGSTDSENFCGCVANISFGCEINEHSTSEGSGYFMGEQTVYSFSASYMTAFRTLYCAVRSTGDCKVFIPFGHTYDSELSADAKYGFDIRPLFELFSDHLEHDGTIAANIAVNPYPNETANEGSENTFLTPEPSCIEKLFSTLSAAAEREGNSEKRSLMLLELHGSEASNKTEIFVNTVDYIRTCLLLSEKQFYSSHLYTIEAYIIDHTVDSSVFSLLDTQNGLETCNAYLAEYLEYSPSDEYYFETVADICLEYGLDSKYLATRGVYSAAISTDAPSAAGTITLWDFTDEDSTLDWKTGENCTAITSGLDMFSRTGLAKIQLELPDGGSGGASFCLSPAYNLSMLSQLKIALQIQLEADLIPELSVTLYSGNSRITYSAAVSPNEWLELSLDLSRFAPEKDKLAGGLDSIDKLTISLSCPEEAENPIILIDSISGSSDSLSDSELLAAFNVALPPASSEQPENEINIQLVIILVVVIFLAATLWIITIVTRLKYIDKSE